MNKIYYHLPGLFEFYEFYKVFLPLFYDHREFFYDWCDIGSVYGAPGDALWGGVRVGFGDADPESVKALLYEYGISARLTFSNSLLETQHLSDKKCNSLLKLFAGDGKVRNGIIICSDLLLAYIHEHFPEYYFVSSTTKVITDFDEFKHELARPEFKYVVPDFRLNKEYEKLFDLDGPEKEKVEFLINECCSYSCYDRKNCYENVSKKSLGIECEDHACVSPTAGRGYRFSDAMKNPGFVSVDDIQNIYAPEGFKHFKIEGRSLGSALILEFLLFYMTKPEYWLKVREEIYLDSSLDLF